MTAALAVVAESGFGAATLHSIARRAGVTRGALYHHFSSKEHIIDAALRERADEVMRPLLSELAGEEPPLQRLGDFVRSYCAALDTQAEFRHLVGLLLSGTPTPGARARTAEGFAQFLQAFESVLRQAEEARDLREGIDPHSAALSVLSAILGATWAHLQAPAVFPASDMGAAVTDTLARGLRA